MNQPPHQWRPVCICCSRKFISGRGQFELVICKKRTQETAATNAELALAIAPNQHRVCTKNCSVFKVASMARSCAAGLATLKLRTPMERRWTSLNEEHQWRAPMESTNGERLSAPDERSRTNELCVEGLSLARSATNCCHSHQLSHCACRLFSPETGQLQLGNFRFIDRPILE